VGHATGGRQRLHAVDRGKDLEVGYRKAGRVEEFIRFQKCDLGQGPGAVDSAGEGAKKTKKGGE